MTPGLEELPLRDIHFPDPVSWWPLAPGWWLLLFFLILIISIVFLYIRYKRNKLRSPYYLAIRELDNVKEEFEREQNPQALIRNISHLFRCMSIYTNNRLDVASLTGSQWLAFLDQTMDGEPFSSGPGRILVEAPYKKQSHVDHDELIQLCEEWIESSLHERKKNSRGSSS